MTGALDAEMRALADDLTSEFGKTVTFVEVSKTFDPSTGGTTETTTETTLAAAPPQDFRYDQIDGSLVKQGDLVIGLPAKTMPAEPTTQDRLKIDGDTWQIVVVRPVASGEQIALYNVQVRQQ